MSLQTLDFVRSIKRQKVTLLPPLSLFFLSLFYFKANLHAHEIGAVTYVECSALNQNTKHVFVEAVNAAFLENPPRIGEAVGLSVKKAR